MAARAGKAFASLRGVFAGAGSDGLSQKEIVREIIALSPRGKSSVVVYLGTATYDLPAPCIRQTQGFLDEGCTVVNVNVALSDVSPGKLKGAVDKADIILVSGGNTLYAVDRWKMHGLDTLFRDAMERGAVLTGGSAGAICWFDGGHSDSMDPDTFKEAMLNADSGEAMLRMADRWSDYSEPFFLPLEDTPCRNNAQQDESSSAPEGESKQWDYIRVPGLGFLPGLVCPHYDKTQSNGVLRATDFKAMMRRHPQERGIGIDHWAALVVDGDKYRVVRVEGKERIGGGRPGVHVLEVVGDEIQTREVEDEGPLETILRHPRGEIEEDGRIHNCRAMNPATLQNGSPA